MSETREWPRIAVVGAGAVGGYFGGMFARAGAPTVFIGRKHFADAVNSKGLVLDTSHGQERISGQGDSRYERGSRLLANSVFSQSQRYVSDRETNSAICQAGCYGSLFAERR